MFAGIGNMLALYRHHKAVMSRAKACDDCQMKSAPKTTTAPAP
ncbi:hypothetical protein OZ411_42670 [Bradyrhizobium sp. Arg237L]|nr:hypothetical protein [Bradyrhizobium sp. Arg237L]MDI4239491.1 hypothetical protein [Bradyrhizobium sp. Arg237L]